MEFRRDAHGRRVVSAKAAAGISIVSVAAGFTVVTQVMAWVGLPSPGKFHTTQQEILRQLDDCAKQDDILRLTNAVDDLDRRMRLFGITDEEIMKRLNQRQGG